MEGVDAVETESIGMVEMEGVGAEHVDGVGHRLIGTGFMDGVLHLGRQPKGKKQKDYKQQAFH